MAGYSGTPLPRKLGITEASRVLLVGAPETFVATLGDLPAGVTLRSDLRGKEPADVALLFVRSRKELETGLAKVILPTSWVDVKVAAIDDVWSGLRFVKRLAAR